MTGMTVHDLTQSLDAGDVVHQNVADLIEGDGIHDLACRAVFKLGEELPRLIHKLNSGKSIPKMEHSTTGRLWRTKDWRPDHLRLVYKIYNDRIVDHFLNGEFEEKEPVLHRQF